MTVVWTRRCLRASGWERKRRAGRRKAAPRRLAAEVCCFASLLCRRFARAAAPRRATAPRLSPSRASPPCPRSSDDKHLEGLGPEEKTLYFLARNNAQRKELGALSWPTRASAFVPQRCSHLTLASSLARSRPLARPRRAQLRGRKSWARLRRSACCCRRRQRR